jgi:hypothetical protein
MQKLRHHHRGQLCIGISHRPFAVIKAKDMPQPQLTGVTLSAWSTLKVVALAHQVESRLRGATVGGKPTPTVEGYLKRPPPTTTTTSWCLRSIVFLCAQSYFVGGQRLQGPTIEGSGEGTRLGDIWKLKPKATSRKCCHYHRSEAAMSPWTRVSISFDRLCSH